MVKINVTIELLMGISIQAGRLSLIHIHDTLSSLLDKFFIYLSIPFLIKYISHSYHNDIIITQLVHYTVDRQLAD